MSKLINVTDATHRKLKEEKRKLDVKSFDAVIRLILEERKWSEMRRDE